MELAALSTAVLVSVTFRFSVKFNIAVSVCDIFEEILKMNYIKRQSLICFIRFEIDHVQGRATL